MTDSKTADCKAFFTAATPDKPDENMSSKTKRSFDINFSHARTFSSKPLLCRSYISAF